MKAKRTSSHILETDVESYLILRAHARGWGCEKFDPGHDNGMPDRLILLPNGRCWWVESKTKGGVLRKLQRYKHKILRNLGQNVSVVWTKEQADELMTEIEKTL